MWLHVDGNIWHKTLRQWTIFRKTLINCCECGMLGPKVKSSKRQRQNQICLQEKLTGIWDKSQKSRQK